jgi:predicted acylesterase/phospholipase RssA
MSQDFDIPTKQRALVLGGGGSLGAYEVGVIKILCQELYKEIKEKDDYDKPLFDIIAGTSIGAMNGAILLYQFLKGKRQYEKEEKKPNYRECLNEAVAKLYEFWTKKIASDPDIGEIQKPWKDQWEKDKAKDNDNSTIACEETARRYYSVKKLLRNGAPNIYSVSCMIEDKKYFDNQYNIWNLRSNKPLQKSLEKYIESPISTDYRKKEPRFLIFSVDVAEGKTVTFDSYSKNNGYENTKTDLEKNINEKESEKKFNHAYGGINIDHIMASGTLPEFYDYRDINERKFWDGGLLSNIPFRELLQAHQEYWMNIVTEKSNHTIPDLEVYIINLHPPKQPTLSTDHDGIKDRQNDIVFGDRSSHYDEEITNLITDYKNFVSRIKNLSEKAISKVGNNTEKEQLKEKFDDIMKTFAISKDFKGNQRRYTDLLKGQFKLIKVQRIENTDYVNSIYGKTGDFSAKTIRQLIEQGEKDALSLFHCS